MRKEPSVYVWANLMFTAMWGVALAYSFPKTWVIAFSPTVPFVVSWVIDSMLLSDADRWATSFLFFAASLIHSLFLFWLTTRTTMDWLLWSFSLFYVYMVAGLLIIVHDSKSFKRTTFEPLIEFEESV